MINRRLVFFIESPPGGMLELSYGSGRGGRAEYNPRNRVGGDNTGGIGFHVPAYLCGAVVSGYYEALVRIPLLKVYKVLP